MQNKNLPDEQLEDQGDPEPRVRHGTRTIGGIGGDRARADVVGGKGSGADGGDGSQHLAHNEGEAHVHAGQGLQQDHTEAQALDCVENAQPQPDAARRQGATREPAGDPGHVVPDARDTPPDLGPAGGTETAGEHGQDPAVFLGEVAEDEEEAGPDETEEDNAENDDLPGFCVGRTPEDCNRGLGSSFTWTDEGDLQFQLRP